MKKQTLKRIAALGLAGVLSASMLTGCGSLKEDEIVVTIGEDQITAGMANFYARMQQAQYETYYAGMMGTTGEDMWEQTVDEKGTTFEKSVKDGLLTTLENMYLIEQHAEEYGVVVSDEEIAKIQDATKKFEDDNALEDKEAVSGKKQYVEEFLRMATIQKKMEKAMKSGVNEEVSDEEAAQKSMKYVFLPFTKADEEGKQVDLTDEEKVEIKEQMKTFVDNLNASETKNLEAAAAEAGYEVQSATFDAETTSPDANLVKAVDALAADGEITGVIESDYGVFVGQLTSFLDREATDQKKLNIIEERKQAQFDDLLETWRKETKIEENKKVWDQIDFQKLGVTVKESDEKYEDAPAGN